MTANLFLQLPFLQLPPAMPITGAIYTSSLLFCIFFSFSCLEAVMAILFKAMKQKV